MYDVIRLSELVSSRSKNWVEVRPAFHDHSIRGLFVGSSAKNGSRGLDTDHPQGLRFQQSDNTLVFMYYKHIIRNITYIYIHISSNSFNLLKI